MLRTTAFHPRTSALCEGQNWRRWAGYLAASSYDLTHDREYWAIRNSAALIDVSPLFKYHVNGPDAARLLDRVMTRDVENSKVGQVLYTTWCDGDGKVLDDGTVSRLDEDLFRVTAADPNYRWLGDNARGLTVDIEDVSDRIAALALQGPNARVILEQASQQSLATLKFFRLTTATIRGVPVTITRTGYTGDLGYEVWMAWSDALAVWDALVAEGGPYGIAPAGMLALDIARIEAGLLLLDVDYTSARRAMIEGQKSTPHELSLEWSLSLGKEYFNGHRAIRAEAARGPEWKFVGLEVDWPSLEGTFAAHGLAPRLPTQAVRASLPIYDANSGKQAGYASSSCWSPLLKRYIALAHLETRFATPNASLQMEVTVEHQRKKVQAHVRPLPFFNPERKRA
ncbi:MAG: aminomethyl transferase family protein [Cytophagaceae bacterium]|nr:aminomethyl transferase family protein [Gemmatimonadaceae bacterium]